MLVLHGIYDNGKIKIEEKVLPKGKSKVEILLEDEKLSLLDLPARGMWKNRAEMKDSAEYVSELRKNNRRYPI